MFCANQSFPFLNPETGDREVVMSIMRKPKRKKEVAYFEAWYKNEGYKIHYLRDCSLKHRGCGGFRVRTSLSLVTAALSTTALI